MSEMIEMHDEVIKIVSEKMREGKAGDSGAPLLAGLSLIIQSLLLLQYGTLDIMGMKPESVCRTISQSLKEVSRNALTKYEEIKEAEKR